jgi:acetolactate synthase-1/3 small subunit
VVELSNQDSPQRHLLSVLVENKAGVLARVAGLFARRGFNIFSLAVAPTNDERFSRLTMVVDVESSPLSQIINQLDKLINVVEIFELSPAKAVQKELLLATIKTDAQNRGQVITHVGVFGGKVIDVGQDCLTVELVGEPESLDAFEQIISPFGIVNIQRTGTVALPKLS